MLVVIKGAGDLASGIAVRLRRARFQVVMTELSMPTTIRRTVSFSQVLTEGTGAATVEGMEAFLAPSVDGAGAILAEGRIAVLVDPDAACVAELCPDVVVDAILAKENLGTQITDAPVVVAVGPGFTAGTDCHAVIETCRGHDLGRVILYGGAAQNTGVPGEVGGQTGKRVLRAPCAGVFRQALEIGARVTTGDVIGRVGDVPLVSELDGILRGVLADGMPVVSGMKCGDVDPRAVSWHCQTISDKARAVGGGVLEAILQLYPGPITLR